MGNLTGSAGSHGELREWRAARWSRLGPVAIVLPTAVLFSLIGVISDFPAMVFVSAALLPFFVWRCAFHCSIELSSDTLVVRNPFTTQVVQLADIVTVESGYSGIEIRLRNGKKRTAWAVQRANLSLLLRRETRSDRIVAEIRAAALVANAQ